jgi:hypothetical protein
MKLDELTARRVERAQLSQRLRDTIAHARETGCLCMAFGPEWAERWAERIRNERTAAGFSNPERLGPSLNAR